MTCCGVGEGTEIKIVMAAPGNTISKLSIPSTEQIR